MPVSACKNIGVVLILNHLCQLSGRRQRHEAEMFMYPHSPSLHAEMLVHPHSPSLHAGVVHR